MGLFSLVGSLIGSGSKKKASRKAEAALIASYEKGIGEQQRQFDTTRADFAPYRDTGAEALGGLGDLVGVNGDDAQLASIAGVRSDPFYQSLYRNGEEALLQSAAATGGLRGGNMQRGLADFGADTLMKAIERQLASLGGLAGMGLGSTEAVANFGAGKANAITELLGQQGQARASGLLTRGGINAANWQNAGSFLDEAVSAALGAGAGPGGAKFNFGNFAKSIF